MKTDRHARPNALVLVSLLVIAGMMMIACADSADAEKPTPTSVSGSTVQATATTGADAQPSATTQEGQTSVKQWSSPPAMQLEAGKDYWATLKTSMGDVVVDLDEQGAPITVNNFVFLAEAGYYENVPFHRVIKGFMIQTGDPTGTGAGGPGYRFADEPVTRDYAKGTLAMANAGKNTNGSQFFICQVDLAGRLPKNYTIFGQVTEGLDVVDAIANVPVKASASGELSSPKDPVTLLNVEIFTK